MQYRKNLEVTIINFYKESKIFLTVKINTNDIGKRIYFLQNNEKHYLLLKEHIINLKNFVIYINDKIYESKNYFIAKAARIYHITIFLKNIIHDCCFFCGCWNIIKIDLSSFDTKNVTDISWMFLNCSKLTNLDLSSFDTKNDNNWEELLITE